MEQCTTNPLITTATGEERGRRGGGRGWSNGFMHAYLSSNWTWQAEFISQSIIFSFSESPAFPSMQECCITLISMMKTGRCWMPAADNTVITLTLPGRLTIKHLLYCPRFSYLSLTKSMTNCSYLQSWWNSHLCPDASSFSDIFRLIFLLQTWWTFLVSHW